MTAIMNPAISEGNAITYDIKKAIVKPVTTRRPRLSRYLDCAKEISPKSSWIDVVSCYSERYTTRELSIPNNFCALNSQDHEEVFES